MYLPDSIAQKNFYYYELTSGSVLLTAKYGKCSAADVFFGLVHVILIKLMYIVDVSSAAEF